MPLLWGGVHMAHHITAFFLTWQSFYCTRQIKPKRESLGFRLWVGTRLNCVPSSCSTYHILKPNKKTPIPSRLTYNWVLLHIVRLNFWTGSMSLGTIYGWTFTHFKLSESLSSIWIFSENISVFVRMQVLFDFFCRIGACSLGFFSLEIIKLNGFLPLIKYFKKRIFIP